MVGAAFWFLFGALTAGLSLQLPMGTARLPGTGLFPLALGVALMGLAAVQFAREYRARPAEPAPLSPEAAAATRRVLLFMAAVAASTALLLPLGYVASSFLLMLALLAVFGLRRWGVAIAIAAGSAAASWVIFVRWLNIPMPSGWMF
jgi:hypothetical protein